MGIDGNQNRLALPAANLESQETPGEVIQVIYHLYLGGSAVSYQKPGGTDTWGKNQAFNHSPKLHWHRKAPFQ